MSTTLAAAINDARNALATFAGVAFHCPEREPLREQARRLLHLMEAHASKSQYRSILMRYRDELFAALQRRERADLAARQAKAGREQLLELLAEAGRHAQLSFVYPWRSLVRRADEVIETLRRSGGEEPLRLAQEISQLASRLEARAILRQRRSWRR